MKIIGKTLKEIKNNINEFKKVNPDIKEIGVIHLDCPDNEEAEPYFIQEFEDTMNTFYFQFNIGTWCPVIAYQSIKDIGVSIEEYTINYFEDNDSATSNEDTIKSIMNHFNVEWKYLDCYTCAYVMG